MSRYRDRVDAGRVLGGLLAHHGGGRPLVLGIPRGGVVVAAEVARSLGGELGSVLAAKVGSPWSHEYAIGAVAPDGVPLLDEPTIAALRLDPQDVEAEVSRAASELRRRRAEYGASDLRVADRVVIVVDDGVATGATLSAVLGYVRRLGPSWLVCAVPVGPPATMERIADAVDELVCPLRPDRFRAVGEWYESFGQTSDDEVRDLLGIAP